MKNSYKIFLMLLIVTIVTACNKKVYFTSEVRNKIESKNIDLRKLQYFIDNDVIFKRELSSDTARVTAGNIIFQNGKYYQTITLLADTKGVCTAVYPNRLMLAFETGDNKNIKFSIPKSLGSYDVYQMVDEDADGNPTNVITYDGQVYSLIKKYNYLPRLMIRKRQIDKEDRNDRVMKGRNVN